MRVRIALLALALLVVPRMAAAGVLAPSAPSAAAGSELGPATPGEMSAAEVHAALKAELLAAKPKPDVAVSAIPEPSALVYGGLICGAIGLYAIRLQRKRESGLV